MSNRENANGQGVQICLTVTAELAGLFDDLVGTFYGGNRADIARFFLLKGVHDNGPQAFELAALRASGGRLEALPGARPIADGDRWLCPYCREAAHRNRANVLRHMDSCDKRPAGAAAETGEPRS